MVLTELDSQSAAALARSLEAANAGWDKQRVSIDAQKPELIETDAEFNARINNERAELQAKRQAEPASLGSSAETQRISQTQAMHTTVTATRGELYLNGQRLGPLPYRGQLAEGSYSDGWRFFEAAQSDTHRQIQWNNGNTIDIKGTGTAVGTGRANTAAIIAAQGSGSYAAMVCRNLNLYDSYSCRAGKGTHFGINRVKRFFRLCSENHSVDSLVLKLDIRGFFMHINRPLLLDLLSGFLVGRYTHPDTSQLLGLCRSLILNDPLEGCTLRTSPGLWQKLPSDKSLFGVAPEHGLPIGNLSSQVLANFYLNGLDHYCKHELGQIGRAHV